MSLNASWRANYKQMNWKSTLQKETLEHMKPSIFLGSPICKGSITCKEPALEGLYPTICIPKPSKGTYAVRMNVHVMDCNDSPNLLQSQCFHISTPGLKVIGHPLHKCKAPTLILPLKRLIFQILNFFPAQRVPLPPCEGVPKKNMLNISWNWRLICNMFNILIYIKCFWTLTCCFSNTIWKPQSWWSQDPCPIQRMLQSKANHGSPQRIHAPLPWNQL